MSFSGSDLAYGSKVALSLGMTRTITRLAVILSVLLPAAAAARPPQAEPNVNSRYPVESVSVSGVPESALSQALRDDMQTLVGKPFDQAAADDLARRMREQLRGYRVNVKVKRGAKPESVTVGFEAEQRRRPHGFDVAVSPLLYSTNDAFSVNIVPAFETHHNYFQFGLVSDADELLERNMGVVLRYEHRKVGTEMVQVGFEYDYFHPSFQPETEAALAYSPWVPGIYRTRENFSPSVSVLPIRDIKITFGAGFQTLAMQYPALHDETANAFTFDAEFRHVARPKEDVRHSIGARYSVRHTTASLESDFLYTRQLVSADYTASVGPHEFGFRFQGGHTGGVAPLFERFSLGNTGTLRGWDKFDVAPVGGTRLAYGSLEYHYRPFLVFYDFGTVWDPGQSSELKHSVGLGLAWKNGFFMALGVPLRFTSVTPTFMLGFKH
jgi:hypothetical protein